MQRSFLEFLKIPFVSKRWLTFFLVAAPILVLFLSTVAIWEMPMGLPSQEAPQSQQAAGSTAGTEGSDQSAYVPHRGLWASTGWHHVLEHLVRVALILLVVILLYFPIAWMLQFSKFSKLMDEEESDIRAEFLGWLTAISIPYLVLGFAMMIEFHALLEDPAKGVGAIAAIMVLYALSVLSSFLYIEVRDLRSNFSKEIKETGEWLRYSLKLANYQTPIGTPAQNVATLLKKWIELLGRSGAAGSDPRNLRQNLLGTLLASYIKEESENIGGELSSDRTPVWVSEVKKAAEKRGDAGGVAFIATNVGFYAQYLATAVEGLAHSLSKEQSVVLATVTYVLPPFWWNWPYASEHHGIYEPVQNFRKTLVSLAEKDAQNGKSLRVFRRMLVRSTNDQISSGATKLSDKTLHDVFVSTFSTREAWNEMIQWKIFKDAAGNPLTSRVRSPVNEDQLPGSIRWTKGNLRQNEDESQVYWMCNGTPESGTDSEVMTDYYKRLMHPSGGASQVCEIGFDVFRSPFALDSARKESGGLNGCPEITFIGTCSAHCDNVWTSSPEFGLAFLSNMTKGHDSIFLAVVIAESLVESLWRSVCDTLNPKVIDELKGSGRA